MGKKEDIMTTWELPPTVTASLKKGNKRAKGVKEIRKKAPL